MRLRHKYTEVSRGRSSSIRPLDYSFISPGVHRLEVAIRLGNPL